MIADTNTASRWRGGSPGGGKHLALKGTAGPRAASPGGGGQLTLGWGVWGTTGPRVSCPVDNLRRGLLILRQLHKRQFLLFFFFVLSLIRCRHHSRTLLSTLNSREMFASATAALRTPPCLFLYAGARTDYM